MAIRVRFCELSGPRDTMEGCLAASDLAGVHEPGEFILGYPGSFSQCLMKLSRTCAKIQNGEGARMCALIRVLAAAVALAMSTGSASKHNVAVPVSQFKFVDKKLVLPGATKDALKASPEFQYPQ